MTTLAKVETGTEPAKRATGPKTARGKAVTKLNAVSHGLRSLAPVLPDECHEDWTAHRAGTVAALAALGTLETELAERVALLLWRLRRVVRYETAVTTADMEDAVAQVRGENDEQNPLSVVLPGRRFNAPTYASVRKELEAARGGAASFAEFRDQLTRLRGLAAEHPVTGDEACSLLREVGGYAPDGNERYIDTDDDEFLAGIGVPADRRADPVGWDGWTAGIVRTGVAAVAAASGLSASDLIERAIAGADRFVREDRRKVPRLEALLEHKAEQIAGPERVARGKALLPPSDVLDKLTRYESHLNKQLTQTLHTLERLRAIRDGHPPAPPAALDVTIDAGR
ncbi:MAG: hypothetical protein FJ304_26190 [Planctomycetes bacterium]|nr:hypothetical protein [Planctomycetota bacterium]